MFDPDREPPKEIKLEKIEFTEEEKYSFLETIEFTPEENELVKLITEKGIQDSEVFQRLGNLQSDEKHEEIKKAKNPNLAQINF